MTIEENKLLLKQAFKAIFEHEVVDEKTIAAFFSKDYRQWVDGHELDYQDFIQHIQAQKKRVATVSIDFKSMIAENDKVATVHLIDAITREGAPVRGKVIAQFTIKNKKIVACEELTFLHEAQEKDKDLGSAR
ncbi:nuclear transport factor 2 family protein [Legionella nagasakiensis]|uniref:nuclear transport factor 2 family protein n=1 Tax=Legionella nagasakiensis TaxID=535290 RepID=UPI001056CFE5|nr:nuclear transport factor 2 family protein [Legionella nagasakiensis]